MIMSLLVDSSKKSSPSAFMIVVGRKMNKNSVYNVFPVYIKLFISTEKRIFNKDPLNYLFKVRQQSA